LLPALVSVTDCDPDAGRGPLQAPDATQESAPADDQVRVVDFPTAIDVGFAVRVVGSSAGLTTVSTTELLPVCDPFEQVSV
jgi:hypothetical protein